MRTIVLMRHAKSDWSQPGLSDKERSLNARGMNAAPRMAQWLASEARIPDRVLCSSAVRTRETWQRMCDSKSLSASNTVHESKVEFLDSLYLASPNAIWEEARRAFQTDQNLNSLMLLGHNPGMELLVSALADEEVEFPTAAIAIFASDLRTEVPDLLACIDSKDWKLVKLQIPRALAD